MVYALIFANILLSWWCYHLDPVINFDGVIYITVADLFMQGRFSAATEYYSWPFYSLFLAGTAQLFMVSAETGALIFNTLMVTSLTLAFVCIIAQLSDNNQRIVLIAALVIVLFPSISKYRSFVIRDFGYLACYLWSLYFLLRYCKTFDKIHLASWLALAGLSCLFRFEGIIFVLIAPYFLFIFSATAISHRRTIIAVLSVLIGITSVALVLWYVNDKYMDSVQLAKQAGKDVSGLMDLFIDNIQERIGNQPLGFLSIGQLVGSTMSDVAVAIVRRLAVFYLLFVLYAYVRDLVFNDQLQRRIWLIFVSVNVFLLLAFSVSNNFLVSRYAMATVLTLLILAPFAIDHVFSQRGEISAFKRTAFVFIAAILALISIEGLDVRTDKHHIKAAGQWLAENVSGEERIYSNNKLGIYYARRDPTITLDHLYSLEILELFMQTNEVRTYDYILMVGSQHIFREDIMRQTLGYHFGMPIQMWETDDGLFAFIFQIKKT